MVGMRVESLAASRPAGGHGRAGLLGPGPGHPLGCRRRRMPGRVVFEHVLAALVHGSGYERIANPGGSDRDYRLR